MTWIEENFGKPSLLQKPESMSLIPPDGDLRTAGTCLGGVGVIFIQLEAGFTQNLPGIGGGSGVCKHPVSVGDHIGVFCKGRLGQQQDQDHGNHNRECTDQKYFSL